MKKLLACLLISVFSTLVFGQKGVDQIRAELLNSESEIVLVAAHRAAHLNHPENSIPAIKAAIEMGVDILELDVKVTKDGIPILMHDRTINRTTTGTGEPSDFTYKELMELRLIHNGDTTKEKIPTFKQALKLAKGKALIDIDIKTDKLDPIITEIKRQNLEDHVFWFDNDYEALDYVESIDEDFILMPRAYSYEMADSAITRFQPELIHIDFSFYDNTVVKLIKANKARVWINALGEPDKLLAEGKEDEALERLLKHGANVIQTDQPELLIKALEKRALH